MITDKEVIDCLHRANPRLDVDGLKPADALTDLGLDSLDRYSLFVELQELTGLEVPDEAVPKLDSVASIVDYFNSRMG